MEGDSLAKYSFEKNDWLKSIETAYQIYQELIPDF